MPLSQTTTRGHRIGSPWAPLPRLLVLTTVILTSGGFRTASAQPTEQRRIRAATEDLRRLGTELTAEWVERFGEDQLPGLVDDEALDLVEVDLEGWATLSDPAIAQLLTDALGHSPRDPWGTPYEVRWSGPAAPVPSDNGAERERAAPEQASGGYAVRSCGPDRSCGSPARYAVGPLAHATAVLAADGTVDPRNDDLVWANGFFVRWPAGQ